MDVEIELLKKVPASVVRDKIYDESEIKTDSLWQNGDLDDAWHVPVHVRSVYASMEDIRQYIARRDPSLEGVNWSMCRYTNGNVVVSWGDKQVALTPSEVRGLYTEHINRYAVTNPYKGWNIQCDRDEWPEAFRCGPVRLDRKVISLIRQQLESRLKNMPVFDLEESLENMDSMSFRPGALLSASMAGLTLAQKTKTAAFIYRF